MLVYWKVEIENTVNVQHTLPTWKNTYFGGRYFLYLGGCVGFAWCGGMADFCGGGDHGEVPRLNHGGDQEP
jgi:hypothetical protein